MLSKKHFFKIYKLNYKAVKENTDIDLQNMDIIDVEVELPPIPQEDLEKEEEFHGLVNLVAFPRQVKQYFERPNYSELYSENKFVECFRLSKDIVCFLLEKIGPRISSPTGT